MKNDNYFMKNIKTYSIGIVVWIIINFILFLYLTFNYHSISCI